ncbi:pfs domain-containing protein [Colletotrichum phormii]|uniref:Pfs domain-containing protein n=1 Tax=Colletotrichum phormii TaxID=359342 RepID=A0AAI9ZH99_9PEZI|nr:pfs domain-containing protein [Colletotrichum phormii]KAK1624208.1 pfs domain-containing protein [Colletotrichum phormii]
MQTLVGVTTGLRVSLRPARILPFDSRFWHSTDVDSPSSSRVAVQQWMLHNGKVFPGDASPDGGTALEWVILKGSTEVVLYLYQIWEDQILKGSYDDCWFYEAHRIIANNPSLPEQEMQVLCRISSAGESMVNASQTPLHDALFKGDFDAAIRAAENFSWAIDQRNYEGNTPLHIAATQGHLESVKHLVHLGCDINEVNWMGRTALTLASMNGHILTVQYLIDAGSWVNATDREGLAAMAAAAVQGHKNLAKVIQALICAGALVNATDSQNKSALHHLTSLRHDLYTIQECLRILLEAGADIELQGLDGKTPLLVSIEKGDHAGTQCLIEAGAKTTCLTRQGQGLLHEAAWFGTTELLRYLSTLNLTAANTDLLDEYEDTPWDSWIYSLHVRDWERGGILKPNPERQEAFVSLFISIRDRNLTADIERLLWLLQYVRDKDQRGATAALSPLIKQKEEWKQWEILGTYKTIGLQIREQVWEAAVESVEEVVDMLREKMAASPWDTKSRWDLWSDTESEDEDEFQTESTGSEDEEWDDAAGDDDDEE